MGGRPRGTFLVWPTGALFILCVTGPCSFLLTIIFHHIMHTQYGLSLLSEAEQESVARMSHVYERIALQSDQAVCETLVQIQHRQRMQRQVCRHILWHYYEASDGRMEVAVRNLQRTLQFRAQHNVSNVRRLNCDGKTLDLTIRLWVGSTLRLRGRTNANCPNIYVDAPIRQPTCRGSTEAWLYCLERTQALGEACHSDPIGNDSGFSITVDCRHLNNGNVWSVPLFCLLHEYVSLLLLRVPRMVSLTFYFSPSTVPCT